MNINGKGCFMEYGNGSHNALAGTNQVIIGASKGIGSEIASFLLKKGTQVLAIGRSNAAANIQISRNYRSCDMRDLPKLIDVVEASFNSEKINGVTLAAGVSYPSSPAISEIARFRATIEINLIAAFDCLQTLKPYLAENSSVVLLTSINADLGFANNPGYVASKAGLDGLTRALAMDWADRKVRVNSIKLGYFPTAMTENSFQDQKLKSERSDRTILGRWGEIHEIFGSVEFLLSNASSYITGHSVPIDGGWLVKGL
jgi:gluconate 5-dehydrogenase